VYGLFASIADAISWMKLSSSFFCACEQQLVVERDPGLRGERLDDALALRAERDHGAVRVARIDQLQHADHAVLVVDHRAGEERLRPVAAALGRISSCLRNRSLARRSVGDVDGLAGVRGEGRHVALVRLTVDEDRDRRQRDRHAGRAALREVQRVVAQDLELELVGVVAQVERAAVGVAELLGFQQDHLDQAVLVLDRRERDADPVKELELRDAGFERVRRGGKGGLGDGTPALAC
jgi:hypothetical protein